MSLTRRLWALRHDRPGYVVLSGVTVALVVVWPAVDALLGSTGIVHVSSYGFNDFGAYAIGVDNWLTGDPIYTEAEDGGYHGSYLYPPFVLPIFYPFAKLSSFDGGAALFGIFSLFLLWVGLESVVEELGYRLSVPERIGLFFGLFGFHPALWNFKWGQVSTLLAAVLSFSFYAHERAERGKTKSQYLSGALTTLGSSVKLFYATTGAHMLRDGRRFVAGMVTAFGILLGSFLVFGLPTHRLYLDVLAWGKGWGTAQRPPAAWETAYYRPMYLLDQMLATVGLSVPNVWIIGATLLGVVGVIGLSLAARSVPEATRPTFALGVAVVPLFAPRAYTHDLVVLLLPAVILLAVELEREDGVPWIPVLAVLCLHLHAVITKAVVEIADASWAVLIQPGAYGTFLLVGLATVRVAEHATVPQQVRGWARAE